MFEALATSTARTRARTCLTSLAFALLSALPAAAHEYWISAEDYTVSPGETVSARLIVGEMMEGVEVPWLSRQIESFRYYAPDEPQDAVGREGDRPALVYEAEEPGLHIIAQQTLPLELTFDTLEEFSEYLAYEGLERFVFTILLAACPRPTLLRLQASRG